MFAGGMEGRSTGRKEKKEGGETGGRKREKSKFGAKRRVEVKDHYPGG